MVRFRSICTAQYGHFAEVMQVAEELNSINRSRGWREGTLMVPSTGEANVLVAEFEYPDFATYQSEGEAMQGDAEWMKTFRRMAEHVYPQSARVELYESAPHLP